MRAALILFGVALVGLFVAGCTSEDPTVKRNACLYEAVRAYPTWDIKNGPLLEHVEQCKGQDATEIRQLMTDFVNAAIRNSARENDNG